MWRPSPRTTLQARVGRRYVVELYRLVQLRAARRRSGCRSASMTRSKRSAASSSAASRPADQLHRRRATAFAQQFSGCTFGTTGGGARAGASTACSSRSRPRRYRARGDRRRRRRDARQHDRSASAPAMRRADSTRRKARGVVDQRHQRRQLLRAVLLHATAIGARTSFSGDLFANYYDSGIGAAAILSLGATGSLSPQFRSARHDRLGRCLHVQPGRRRRPDRERKATLGARYQF